jgi:hypothetical protein
MITALLVTITVAVEDTHSSLVVVDLPLILTVAAAGVVLVDLVL